MKPIKLCITSLYAYNFFNPQISSKIGGAELQLYYLARGLAADPNFDIHFIVGDFGQPEQETLAGVRLHQFSRKRRNFFALWQLLKTINADVYVQRAATMETIVVGLFCWSRRKKFLYLTAHDSDVRPEQPVWLKWGLLGWLRWQIFRLVFKTASLVVVQHRGQQEDLKKYYGRESIIRNSAHPLPDSNVSLADKKYILWVGRCEDWKRPELFLWLARQLPQQSFVMIMPPANDEKLFNQIKQEAQQIPNLNFSDHVPFLEVENYFRRAKIFIITSVMEGFPNVLIQAAKYQTPILSLGINPDNILEKFKMGKCFSQMGELKLFLDKILNDDSLRQELSTNAYQYAKENHDLEKILAADKRMIQRLISPKIIFAHPAIRQYRYQTYRLLEEYFNIKFIFTEDYDHNQFFLKTYPLKQWQAFSSVPLPFYSKGACWSALKEAMSGDYDIWISSILNSFITHWTFPVVKLRGKKFFLWSEDWWWQRSWKSFLIRPYAKFVARHSDIVLAAGSRTRKFFLDLGVSPEKIFLATNATIDLGGTSRVVNNKQLTILYLGRIVKYKGLDVLIKAFSQLEKESSDIFLKIVGDGDFKSYCQELTRKLAVKNIQFISATRPEDAKEYYHQANCFVLPARFVWQSNVPAEAWGFTVNEALSAGLPVIATEAVAAADDLIENGVNGFIVPSADPVALYGKLKWLLVNPEVLVQMRQSALEKIKSFTPHHQYQSFVRAIEWTDNFSQVAEKIKNVHGWLSDKEAKTLYQLAQTVPPTSSIVEIGSWQGRSTICLAAGSQQGFGAQVYAIDPHQGAVEQKELFSGDLNTLDIFKKNIHKANLDDLVVPLVKTSEVAAQSWCGPPVALLFIDGSHLYNDVKRDFDLWNPLLPLGGLIAFHDSFAPGPSRVLEECIYFSKTFRVIKIADNLTVAVKVGQSSWSPFLRQRLIGWRKKARRYLKLLLKK